MAQRRLALREDAARPPNHDQDHRGARTAACGTRRNRARVRAAAPAPRRPVRRPSWLPMPPRTTMARMIADSLKVNDSGEMKPWRAAKKTPASPPSMAPMAKAESLTLVDVHSHRLASDLVLAHRFPGAADRQAAQARNKDVGEQRQGQDQVVEKKQAMHRRIIDAEETGEGRSVVTGLERQTEERRARDRRDAVGTHPTGRSN